MSFLACNERYKIYSEDEVRKTLNIHGIKLDEVMDYVKIIKDWLKTQPHIPVGPSDRQIAYFLLMNKFSIENTKVKLDMNYTIRSLIPEYYSKAPSHPDIQKALKAINLGLLPKLNERMNRVVVWRMVSVDDFEISSIFSIYCLMYEIRTLLDFNNADEYILDLSYCPLSMVKKYTPMDLKRLFTIMEKVYSTRVGAFHIVNFPSYAQPVLNLSLKLVKPKIRRRLIFHDSYESLHKNFDVDQLPKEFGGNGSTFAEIHEETKNLLMQHEAHLKQFLNARVNEDLRPSKLINDDILGFHGNFRQLQVD